MLSNLVINNYNNVLYIIWPNCNLLYIVKKVLNRVDYSILIKLKIYSRNYILNSILNFIFNQISIRVLIE